MTAPSTAKKPADRKAKATAEPAFLLQATVRGIDITVEPEALDDFELLGDLRAAQEGSINAIQRLPLLLERLLGPEQSRQALGVLRNPQTGRVSLEDGVAFVGEVFDALLAEAG